MSHRGATRRWMYKGGRRNRLAAVLNRVDARVGSSGLGPSRLITLEVRGRKSGRMLSFPLVVADYEGERYLVAMLGKGTNWVRNVRAAGGEAAVISHHRREEVRLEEVDPDERAPILRRYLELAPGARAHIPVDRHDPLEAFERIAPEIPVFRVSQRRGPRPQPEN